MLHRLISRVGNSISIKWTMAQQEVVVVIVIIKGIDCVTRIYSCVCVCMVCVLFSFFVAGGKCNKQSFLIEPMFSTIVMNIPLYHHRGRIDDAAGTRHGFDDIDMLGIAPCCMVCATLISGKYTVPSCRNWQPQNVI